MANRRTVMPRLAPIGMISIAVFACGRSPAPSDATGAASPLHLERRAGAFDATPEAALRTYWRLSDAQARSLDAALVDSVDSLFTGPAAAARAQSRMPESFSREIVSVERRGARAFVTVRVFNTTPRPLGATPSRDELRRRRTGEPFRYVLVQEDSLWRIQQIQAWNFGQDEWRDWFDPTPRLPIRVAP